MSSRQRTPHLIGRESSLAELFEALGAVTPSHGSLVLVSGEVGIGKTRLLDEFAARAEGTRVARGGCVEGVAYAPWTELLWWLLGTVDPVGVDELPPGVRSQLVRLMPRLAAGEARDADDEDGQHLLFEAVVDLLAYTAARTKLVLIVDDVHWIDPASRELLRYVAGNLRRIPILLVAAYRVEDAASERELIAQLGRLGDRRIALERLAEDATAEMAAVLLGSDARRADAERIAREADGNPLFVEELVAALGTARVPETVRDLMLVRFASLDDDARHLVRTAALIGPRAPRAWLVSASGLSDDHARASARQSVDAGVLLADDDGRGYEFRHALLRQAVLDDLLPDERIVLHRAIAEALTNDPKRAVGVDRAAELARHWDGAEHASSALHWQVAAAQQAQATYAFEAAFDAYERALFWWEAVADAPGVAGIDHVALLLEAADAAGFAGRIERGADLARAGLDEACALDLGRGVEAAGRVYPLLWTADRAPELFEFTSRALLPVLDHVEPRARAGFLVSHVEHLVGYAAPADIREPALLMMEALRDIDDPVLEARAHIVNAWCYEAYGEFDRVGPEYDRAAEVARAAHAYSVLALALYNHAAFKTSVPDLAAAVRLLDDVDELVERFGLRRYLVPARRLRALATCLQGDLEGATRAIASVDELFAEGFEAWTRAAGRALINLSAGDFDAVLAGLEPDAVGVAAPQDSELAIEIAMLRADALAWKGDLDAARRAVDVGEAAVEHHRETYWHGWLAMVAVRVEADAVVAATAARALGEIEYAQSRAARVLAAWKAAVAQLQTSNPLVDAYSRAIEVELARVMGEDVAVHTRKAADAFDGISMPYYATYFAWREAHATLESGDRPAATELLKRARVTARTHGFAGLEAAIMTLARAHQLRLGPGRTSVDGDEALSVRELEVLRLMVDGKSNPEIADILFISPRTAAAHVSSILRKFNASSRVEAVSHALRRGFA